jgi:hypothetical protein
MKKITSILFGISLLTAGLIPIKSKAQVIAFGYYTISEKCPESDGYQKRCRPDGPDWCRVSQQTSCPEFPSIG